VDPTAVERLLDVAGEQLGPIDVLVANAAATGGHGPLTDTRADGFSRMLGTNVVANFVLARVTAQRMADRAGGSIVFVTSIAAAAPMPGNVAYAASKAGLTSMAMSLAAEYAARGVRVNCVAPGLIRSRASTAAFGGNGALDRYAADRIPTGRVGEAEEVGAACVFLASTAGAYITATVLPVDGGSAGLAGAHGG
jgi:NAD(P)-dependent dehydrogenase (short-subunit alcohol dehydrogenase family)